ncbi:MAG: hypothetical protein HWE22_18000 [Flavobacteriales bacterium]|nr:hypothetical protein [Flavobacteriales bacterium]
MNYRLIFILFLNSVSSLIVLGQDSVKIALDINIINPCFGFENTSISGQVSTAEDFILSNNNRKTLGFGLVELDFYPVKFVGFRLGTGFSQSELNDAKIKSEFQQQFNDYSLEFPATDFENGVVPISGGFKPFYWHAGIIGEINIGRVLEICPSVSYIRSYSGERYVVYANFTETATNDQFRRAYNFRERNYSGMKFGLDFRYDPKEFFYLGLRMEYTCLNSSGISGYEDLYDDGTLLASEINNYSRKTSYFLFGVNLGLHLYHKRKL